MADEDDSQHSSKPTSPPGFKEFPSYETWKKAFRFWQSKTSLTKKQQARYIQALLSLDIESVTVMKYFL